MDIIFVITMITIQLIVMLLAPKHASDNVRKESMSKVDFQRDKDYYRDIVKEYSAMEISYIDDFKVEEKKDIVSTILNLELKKKIEIIDNKIIIIDTSVRKLKKTEKFVLQNIKNGKVIINSSNRMLHLIKEEALRDKLIKKNNYKDSDNTKFALSVLISFFVTFFSLINIQNTYIAMIIMFFEFFYIIYATVYREEKIKSYSRTDKGEELNRKIEGLKQYIKDYSLLHEKDREDLILWEEYLIYSVIFNLNDTKIVEEISKLIEIKN